MGDIREVRFKDPIHQGAVLTERFTPSMSSAFCPHCGKRGMCWSRIEFESRAGFSENVCVRCGCLFWLSITAPEGVLNYDRAAMDALRADIGIKAPYKVPVPAQLEEATSGAG